MYYIYIVYIIYIIYYIYHIYIYIYIYKSIYIYIYQVKISNKLCEMSQLKKGIMYLKAFVTLYI